MMRSRPRPSSTARSAEPIADWISASYITLCASHGCERAPFSSIMRASRSQSRLPQFTPIRTGLSYLAAASIICANCVSRFAPWPTLPGLIRYFDSDSAQPG